MNLTNIITFAILVMTPLTQARAEIFLPKKEIIRPSSPNELSNFEAEACAKAVGNSNVNAVCFGHGRFQNFVRIRAIQIQLRNGAHAFYVENGLPGVEILNPQFDVIGPIGGTLVREPISEIGKVALEFDQDGNLEALSLSSVRLGEVRLSFSSQGL